MPERMGIDMRQIMTLREFCHPVRYCVRVHGQTAFLTKHKAAILIGVSHLKPLFCLSCLPFAEKLHRVHGQGDPADRGFCFWCVLINPTVAAVEDGVFNVNPIIFVVNSSPRDGEIIRSNLEQFHFALEQSSLISDKIGTISFEQAVCDYNQKDIKTNLICRPRIKTNGEVYAEDAPSVRKLDTIYVTSDLPTLFAGLFEIVYQVRNCLIHGKMNPSEREYQVVKYGYMTLFDLMSF